MIRSICKQLWTLRKRNVWLYAELLISFCLVWYIVDYGTQVLHNRLYPSGFEIEGLYTSVYRPEPGESFSPEQADRYETLIRHYPGIKQVYATAYNGIPYTGSWRSHSLSVDTTARDDRTFLMTYEVPVLDSTYFDLLNIRSVYTGKPLRLDYGDPNCIILSQSLSRYFFADQDPRGRYVSTGETNLRVIDVSEDFKVYDYQLPVLMTFSPINKEDSPNRYLFSVDKDFDPQAFSKDIIECKRLDELKQRQELSTGITKRTLMLRTTVAFFVVCISLGVIGSFWFRIQSRRGELALRLSLGCSPCRLSLHIVLEALLLLLAASLPAILINYCVFAYDLNMSVVEKAVAWYEPDTTMVNSDPLFWINVGWKRFAVGHILSFGLMGLVVSLSAWLPARQIRHISPIEALRHN